jgi:hypothetical protein
MHADVNTSSSVYHGLCEQGREVDHFAPLRHRLHEATPAAFLISYVLAWSLSKGKESFSSYLDEYMERNTQAYVCCV